MSLQCGIVGLPNVGKSTLFNCLSNAKAQSANFPFCTIEPNVGVITVPDERLNELAKLVNPATEAQAIDRAYRIGQTKPVVAYKMITKNTIEEKVLQMQEKKRHLAETYLKETPSPAKLSKEDLRFLLEP